MIQLLGIAHPVDGKLFQVSKVHLGMGCIRGLRDEGMAIYGIVMYFEKIWIKTQFWVIVNELHFV